MTEPNKQNSLVELIEFFGCPGRPVTTAEFKHFWNSCSPSDKEYYKNAPLT